MDEEERSGGREEKGARGRSSDQQKEAAQAWIWLGTDF